MLFARSLVLAVAGVLSAAVLAGCAGAPVTPGQGVASSASTAASTEPVELRSVSSTSSTVLGAGAESLLREYAALADAAVRDVSGTWGAGTEVTMLVAADAPQLARWLRATAAPVPGRAAVTVPASSVQVSPHLFRGGAPRPVIMLDAAAMAGLTPAGRRVVVTHEAVHVAAWEATPAGLPVWLSEGFADYIAFTAAEIPLAVAAGPALKRAAAGFVDAAPAPEHFRGPGADLAYQSAYLTCRFVAQRYGEAQLVAWYRAVGARAGQPDGVQLATRQTLGVHYDRLLTDAEAAVRALARAEAR